MGDDRHILTQWLALEDAKTTQQGVLLEDPAMVTKYACFYLANSLLWSCRVKDAALLRLFFDLFDRLLHKEGMGVFFVESMAGFSHVSLDLAEDQLVEKSEPAEKSAEPLTAENIAAGIEKPVEDLNGE